MIRFIFGIALAYFVLRIVRLLIDPIFERPATKTPQTPKSPPHTDKPNLGEYVDYEEVK